MGNLATVVKLSVAVLPYLVDYVQAIEVNTSQGKQNKQLILN